MFTYKFSPTTVIVSRVQRFIDNCNKIYPVSCTAIKVQDSYYDVEGDYSFYETIAGSRVYTTKVLKGNAGVLIDLSELRPKGTVGSGGMVAQGVTNFMAMYSMINQEVRRGSVFKNGAVVLALDYDHPDFIDFLNFPDEQIPWAKRNVGVDEGILKPEYATQYDALLKTLADGRCFVTKKQYNKEDGSRMLPNVCVGLTLRSRSTCTLAHGNLGMVVKPSDIADVIFNGAKDVIHIWDMFNEAQIERGDHFLDAILDKQVGFGFVGLANMLAHFQVSYADFVGALEGCRDNVFAWEIASSFRTGYGMASVLFKLHGFERAFTIEPTATCSYKQTDLYGYTTTPEISPPVCHPVTKVTRRLSEVAEGGYQDYQYPPNVEVAGVDVDDEVYTRLCCAFQVMMNDTGLAQMISYNWWLTRPIDKQHFAYWLDSPLQSIYYRWAVSTDNQDKTSIGETTEEDDEFWMMVDESLDENPDLAEKAAAVCGIRTQLNSGSCSACDGE